MMQLAMADLCGVTVLGSKDGVDPKQSTGVSPFARMTSKVAAKRQSATECLDCGDVCVLDADNPKFHSIANRNIRWLCESRGLKVGGPTSPIVLVTSAGSQAADDVRKTLKRNKIDRSVQRVIVGGQGAYSPAAYSDFADAACVGEATDFIEMLASRGITDAMRLPCVFVSGDSEQVIPCHSFDYNFPPAIGLDGRPAVVLSRGCKRKCLFCPSAWTTKYSQHEHDYLSLKNAYKNITLITNDAAAVVSSHDGWVSATVDAAERCGMAPKGFRFGVEGVSERLRRLVRKPISHEKLRDVTIRLVKAGVGVRFFLIAGLPSETDEDYQELKDIVLAIKQLPKGIPVGLSFTALLPHPSTPIGFLPIDDSYWQRFKDFETWFFTKAQTPRIQIMRPAQPKARNEMACRIMGATIDQLRAGWQVEKLPNWRVKFPWSTNVRAIAESVK